MHLAYKAHIAVSGMNGQVITAAIATTGARSDEHQLADVLEHHNRLTNLPVREVVADAKYGTIANYELLDRDGVIAFIPPRERTSGPRGVWGRGHFRYLKEQDLFLCPAGVPMKQFAHRASTQRVSYRVSKGACKECRLREQCTPAGRDRTISRFFDQKLVEEAKERLSSSTGQELLKQRKTRAEGVFALAKELHGLRRTRFRGRWRVQIQLWLTAAVINLKRAVKALSKIEPVAASQEVTSRVFITGMSANAAKEIIGVMYRIFTPLMPWKYFGNSPNKHDPAQCWGYRYFNVYPTTHTDLTMGFKYLHVPWPLGNTDSQKLFAWVHTSYLCNQFPAFYTPLPRCNIR
ncbi:MAG: transposase [Chloroflexi bacterium]|nr:transposase [Chloroflexota bacterium]